MADERVEAFNKYFAQQELNPLASARDVITHVEPISEGKVRDSYDLGDKLLIVTSDRVSAFDVVSDQLIPGKGVVLNSLSAYWFQLIRGLGIPTHFITTDPRRFPEPFCQIPELAGRAMLVHKAQRIDVEAIARGFLYGSAWSEYKRGAMVLGELYPLGMVEAQEFEKPIFTPSTKAETGHDVNISYEFMRDEILATQFPNLEPAYLARALAVTTLRIYKYAKGVARGRGILIADTKLEFGFISGVLALIDEALTPDSSRFWPLDLYQPGGPQPSFDKQYLRDYLEEVRPQWSKERPMPELPPDVIANTSQRYREAAVRLLS